MNSKKKIMVGMSGGVDSAAAAILLQEQGYEVAGGTFILFDSSDTTGLNDARDVCGSLNIPHYIFDFREQFRSGVIEYFANEYESGVTPNPCVVCNRVIKFGVFLQKARELGFEYISTGHYAYVIYDDGLRRFRVKKSRFDQKDQSYVLYSLTQEQLGSVILPLGDYDKLQIRELVKKKGLTISQKAESQDICFIPNGDYAGFLNEYLGTASNPGDFIDTTGNILGSHKGIRHYTIGQRKGLGISFDKPMFVADIDSARNTVTLAPNEMLMKNKLIAERVNWIDFDTLTQPLRLKAKIRYSSKPSDSIVTPIGNRTVEVLFDETQRAITAGQSAVFYDGDYLLGGGVISGVK